MADEILGKVSNHWSKVKHAGRSRWWTNPAILCHINRLVCGVPLAGPWAGLERLMCALVSGETFRRGISVGCGNGFKELQLIRNGVVEHFDLFELSQFRVSQGQALAANQGIANRVSFHSGNAFDTPLNDNYDLVYWNNALHHMLDVESAIRWSRERLIYGGYFVMDDFVGASRFQWSSYQIELASQVRTILPERFLRHPENPSITLSRHVARPTVESMIALDPSEAADSDNILPALKRVFPRASVTLTGGVIYHLALNDVLANFDDLDDDPLLQSLLLLDETVARAGETQYAVAIASKE